MFAKPIVGFIFVQKAASMSVNVNAFVIGPNGTRAKAAQPCLCKGASAKKQNAKY
jgi:hypothetical protein